MIALAAVVACAVTATALHRWWASRVHQLNRSTDRCCSLMHDMHDDDGQDIEALARLTREERAAMDRHPETGDPA